MNPEITICKKCGTPIEPGTQHIWYTNRKFRKLAKRLNPELKIVVCGDKPHP